MDYRPHRARPGYAGLLAGGYARGKRTGVWRALRQTLACRPERE